MDQNTQMEYSDRIFFFVKKFKLFWSIGVARFIGSGPSKHYFLFLTVHGEIRIITQRIYPYRSASPTLTGVGSWTVVSVLIFLFSSVRKGSACRNGPATCLSISDCWFLNVDSSALNPKTLTTHKKYNCFRKIIVNCSCYWWYLDDITQLLFNVPINNATPKLTLVSPYPATSQICGHQNRISKTYY